MLNLTFGMFAQFLTLLLILLASWPGQDAPPAWQAEPSATASLTAPTAPRLDSPLPGQALQGKVAILGSTEVPGFLLAELAFSYADDPGQTWFLIWKSNSPSADQLLTEWDTTMITDGDYTLRLTVYLQDGQLQTVTVTGLRVRNYSPIETDTPTPTLTPAPGAAPTATPSPLPTLTPVAPTATPFPPNPVVITRPQILSSLLLGVMLAGGAFLVGGLLLRVHRLRFRH